MPLVQRECTVVLGRESVGKSQLIASLTGANASPANFRGSTVAVEAYNCGNETYLDTPGLWQRADAAMTRRVLDTLQLHERVLLVAQATHLDDDLAELLPLAQGKKGAVAVTFWDKVDQTPRTRQALERVGRDIGIELVPVDARHLDDVMRAELLAAMRGSKLIERSEAKEKIGWRIEPRNGWFEHRFWGPLLALLTLFLPAIVAVYGANTFAGVTDPVLQNVMGAPITVFQGWPGLTRELLVGRYGLVTMGPLLLVWAVPTVILYSGFLGVYKASGLIDRATVALDPLLRPIGLSGRDLVRVVMGWGCNVPAIIATRSCSSCSRGTCVSAIAFGAACSYQFGATLGVFAAAKRPELVWPYLAWLGSTSLIYTRFTAPRVTRMKNSLEVSSNRNFLQWPRPDDVWRESRTSLRGFFMLAMPVFFVITLLASLLDYFGVLKLVAVVLTPLMGLMHLPAEVALLVVMASIRKDGILLLAEGGISGRLSGGQLLTSVYLAGTLLPCLVTTMTIGREMGMKFMARLLLRQMASALVFAWLLSLLTKLMGAW